MELPARVEAARPDGLELLGYLGLAAAAAILALGALVRPSLVLLLVLGGGAVVVFLLRTDLALLLVVATAPLEGAFSSGPAGISVTKLTGGLLFASFLFSLARGRQRLVFERGQALVLGILALALVSTLQAQDTSAALTTTSRYASFAAVYVIITQLGHDRLLQRRIAWTLAAACSVAAALGLHEYLSGNQQLATLPNVNQNDFAYLLATSLPLMFFLLGGHKLLRPFVLAAIALVSAAILLSLSRGALVGIAAGFIVFVITDRRRVRVTLAAGALATIGTIAVIQSNPQRFHEALSLKSQVAQENISTRFGAWGAASRLAADHPFLGVGPGNFQFYYNKLTGQPVGTFTLTVAHNALLDIGAELGLAAMFLLAAYLVLAFVRLTTCLERGYGDQAFVRALRISLTIAIVSAMFLSEQYFLPFWLLGGLAAAIWVDGQRQARQPAPAA
ncbi:MAG TPA: O-antigen ligase family protein [Gaiellaceae bacterium]